jgi:hypothetical protein
MVYNLCKMPIEMCHDCYTMSSIEIQIRIPPTARFESKDGREQAE